MKNFLFEVSPVDPATGLTTTLRMSSASADAGGVVVDGYQWLPLITDIQPSSYTFWQNGQHQPVTVGYGSISFYLSQSFGNQAWSKLSWEGAEGRIYMGQSGDPFSAYTQIFEGAIGPITGRDGGIAGVALLGMEARIEKPILSAEYTGAGGINGTASNKGNLKPRAFGNCLNVEPVLIDPVYMVFQVSAYGPIQSIDMVYENAYSVAATSQGDFTDYTSLVAASLSEGQWATCVAQGLFRLGAQNSGVITADIKGEKQGSTYNSTLGNLLGQLIEIPGLVAAQYDATTFTPFATYDWCRYITSQETVGDTIRQGLFQVGGYLYTSASGVFKAGDYYGTKATTALTHDRSTLPLVQDVKQLAATAPSWKVKMGGDKNWKVLSTNEISQALADTSGVDLQARDMAQSATDAATAAQAQANTVQAQIDNMVNDGVLDRSDKAQLLLIINNINGERSGINSQAVGFGLGASSQVSAWNAAYSALITFVTALSPAYTDLTQNTTVDGPTLRTKITTYNSARQAVMNSIAQQASLRADWSNVTGAGRPSDYAGNNRGTNELTDELFSPGFWTLTNCSRVSGTGLSGFDASFNPYILEIVSGGGQVATSPVARVRSGMRIWFTVRAARSSVVAPSPSPTTLNVTLKFEKPDGTQDSTFVGTISSSDLAGNGSYKDYIFTTTVPSTSTRARLIIAPSASITTGIYHIDAPTITHVEPGATKNSYRGTWAAGTQYYEGDFLDYSGQVYYVKIAHLSDVAVPPPNSNLILFTGAAGSTGPTGPAGPQGPSGAAGSNGQSLYTWIAYADSSDGTSGFTNGANVLDKPYIGIANNKTSPTESSTPTDYTWTKIQGAEGIPGTPGADGHATYTWFAYADSADGTTNFTTGDPGSRAYLGLAANQTTATESTDPTKYFWTKIQGPQGTPGANGSTGPSGPAGPQGPSGANGQTLYTWVAYASNLSGTSNFTTGTPDSSHTCIGLANNKTTSVESNDPTLYTWSLMQGTTGVPGTPGRDGQPTYTWFAYADSADGTVNFTTGVPGGRAYLGISANQLTATESTNPVDYYWSRIAGAAGDSTKLYDPMTYLTASDFTTGWTTTGSSGEVAIVSSTDTGGKAVQLGNNGGNDYYTAIYNKNLPYNHEDLYMVSFDVEVFTSNASAKMFLGVQALDNANTNLPSSAGTYHYVAANNVGQTTTGRVKYVGYFRGLSSTGTGLQANDPTFPQALPVNTTTIRPVLLVNYPNLNGKIVLHAVEMRKVDDITVTPTGAYDGARVYYRNEMVTYLGRSFACRTSGTQGQTPPNTAISNTYWFLVADKGVDGLTGAQGPAGPNGTPGLNAPNVLFQFATLSTGAWQSSYFTGCKWFRMSNDNGASYNTPTQLTAANLQDLDTGAYTKLNGIEVNADVTSVMTGPTSGEVVCSYTGAPVAGQLPLNMQFARIHGSVNVSQLATCTWSAGIVSGSASVSVPTPGYISLSSIATDCVIQVVSTYNNVVRSMQVSVTRTIQAAPVQPTIVTDSTFNSIANTSYDFTNGSGAGPLTITATKSTATLTGPLGYSLTGTTNGSFAMAAQWQMAVAGGTWTNVGPEIQCDYAAYVYRNSYTTYGTKYYTLVNINGGTTDEIDDGAITVNTTAPMNIGTTYNFRLLLRRASGVGTAWPYGTITLDG